MGQVIPLWPKGIGPGNPVLFQYFQDLVLGGHISSEELNDFLGVFQGVRVPQISEETLSFVLAGYDIQKEYEPANLIKSFSKISELSGFLEEICMALFAHDMIMEQRGYVDQKIKKGGKLQAILVASVLHQDCIQFTQNEKAG